MPDQYDALARRFGGKSVGPDSYDLLSKQVVNQNPQGPVPTPTAPLDGSMERFLSGFVENVNPVTIAKGLFQAVSNPIDTVKGIAQQQLGQGRQAAQMFGQGRYSEAAGHGLASIIPLIGPAAVEAGERIGQGDVAGGLGEGAGLLAFTAGPSAVRGATTAARAVTPAGAKAGVAGLLERGAADRAAGVMSPQVGPNKVRFGNRAEDVAGQVVKRTESTWTREGLHAQVQEKLAAAERGLDDAANARLSARTFETQPLIDALLEKRKRLTAGTVDASKLQRKVSTRESPIVDEFGKPIMVESKTRQPVGEDVVPHPNAARVAEIDRALAELEQLGPVARYESIRRIREAYDGPAKAIYNPSMTADYLKAQGGKMGAADVTGVLRDNLAKWDEGTAKANTEYSLWKTADDVLEATREVERTRPKVGRQIMTRLTTTLAGGQQAGAAGAAAGFIFAPIVDAAMNMGVTTRLHTAKLMSNLAQAIRQGNEARVVSLSEQLKRIAAQGAAIQGQSTSPSGFQMQPAPAGGPPR